jgi:hypothetical protein
MRSRAPFIVSREPTRDEIDGISRCIAAHWPGRPVVRMRVEWNQYLIIEWQPGAGPVSEVRLPLDHLASHPAAAGDERLGTAERKDSEHVQLPTPIGAA